MSIAENIKVIQDQLKDYECQLVAVGKTKPVEMLMEAYQAGIRDFGENKVQELTEKQEKMPDDVRWHMIGHLQRNKVKYIVPFVHLIHAIDSEKLLKEVEKQAARVNRTVNCLLQIHIAEEETKFGFSEEELLSLLGSSAIQQYQHIQISGLMGMATFTDDRTQVRREFKNLKQIFEKVKRESNLPAYIHMQELSMGMSGDYDIALSEGSTMVRIGTTIFGSRK